MARRRLDRELVERGLAPDLDTARSLISNQRVLVRGAFAGNPAFLITPNDDLKLSMPREHVSRGALKLLGALEDLDISPKGKSCLDAGAGSGGFTQVLLEMGGRAVVAVDVGYGQFDWGLRNDPRVKVFERTNLRKADLGLLGPFDLIVADLSFISLTAVAEALVRAASEDAMMVLLVKPQFEAPVTAVPRGGVITDPGVWRWAVAKVSTRFDNLGWKKVAEVPSRIRGTDGNQEFFIHLKRRT